MHRLLVWFLLAIAIGVIVGFTVLAFHYAIDYVSDYVFPITGEYVHNRLSCIVMPMIGCFLATLIAYLLLPDVAGSGTGKTLEAYFRQFGIVPKSTPALKFVASTVTIGFGGSAGYEGPCVQIGGSIGGILAHMLKLELLDRRIAILSGIAAAIGSIFHAPLAGAFFALELPYSFEIEPLAIIPAIISSATAFSIYATFIGWKPRFQVNATFPRIEDFPFYIVEGLVLGLLSILYAIILEKTHRAFKRLKILPLSGLIGGLLTGLIGYFRPEILGLGYGTVQQALNCNGPLWDFLVLSLLKMVATALTVGSGGSGGVLAPALFIGATAGAWYGLLISKFNSHLNPCNFALLGFGAFLGSAAKTPLTAIILIGEMTGNYNLLVPAMIVTGFAYLVSYRHTIIENQLKRRSDDPMLNIIVRETIRLLLP